MAVKFAPEKLREFNAAASQIVVHGERLRKELLVICELKRLSENSGISQASDRAVEKDVCYRFVIDMASLKSE